MGPCASAHHFARELAVAESEGERQRQRDRSERRRCARQQRHRDLRDRQVVKDGDGAVSDADPQGRGMQRDYAELMDAIRK